MILKGSQRGGSGQLAAHLLRMDENDHVELHEVRGFVADELPGALKEAYAISRGTRCQQFLFSLSLSPPEQESVPVSVFEKAIAKIEKRMGLEGQPRVIIFHEKQGRRHAHCVWSRISADEMKAVNLPHFKLKLRDVSRELYLENGWQMPHGLVNSEERNPLNFSREEWQQAKRAGRDARAIKEIFQDCWAISDGLKAFRSALEARGFYLAQGDRRGFVAIDWQGEVYSVARWTGDRTKIIAAKLGDPADLPSVDEVKSTIARKVDEKLHRFAADIRREFETAKAGLAEKRRVMVGWQREERKLFDQLRAARRIQEAQCRAERFRKGLKGLWDRLTGKHARVHVQNQLEMEQDRRKDRSERQALILRQLEDRRDQQRLLKAQQERAESELREVYQPDPDGPAEPSLMRTKAFSKKPQRKQRLISPAL